MYLLIQWMVDSQLLEYINTREQKMLDQVSERLGNLYSINNSWDFIEGDRRQLDELSKTIREPILGEPPPRPRHHEFRGREMSFPPGGRDHRGPMGDRPHYESRGRFGILDNDKNIIIRGSREGSILTPILAKGSRVGWLVFRPPKGPGEDFDLQLQKSLSDGFLIISFLVLLMSTALAIPLTYFIVRRIKILEKGALAISSGDLSYRVDDSSSDEVGQLASNFNHLAKTLEKNETARKRWIADISHELRTPLAITSGELEAMIDGIRPLNIISIESAFAEIQHLQRLVNDLYEMTNADIGAISYDKSTTDIAELVHHEVSQFGLLNREQNLKITVNAPESAVKIFADEGRLKQLLQNLLQNSFKYTDIPGYVRVSLTKRDVDRARVAELRVEDSGPGVEVEDRAKLFDHLFRVDKSRNRLTGGSGLGLSICRQIVLAHQGHIRAEASELGGLAIIVSIPLI